MNAPLSTAVRAQMPPRRRSDVVFTFTFETYSDAVKRGMNRPPERLLASLRRHPDVGKLLVANPFRSFVIRAARGVLRQGDIAFPATAEQSLYTPMRWRRQDATDVPRLARGYAEYDERLRVAAAVRGLTDPAVITANPLTAGFCDFAWGDGVTYYARDDWAELPARRPWWPAIRAAYRRISAEGRAIVAVSQQILDRIEPTGPALVVPNGVEPTEWAGPPPPEPAFLRHIPHPRALYVGTLDSRLDLDGLQVLAAARPDLHIILLGAQTEGEFLRMLSDVPNIHIVPPVTSRPLLVAAIRNSELCLVAHRNTRLTRAMSPLKIYEYLAAGRPVLCTDLPPCRDISDRVLLTETVADFVDVLDQALGLGPAAEPERQAFLAANSWAARHEDILGVALGSRRTG